MLCIHGEYVPWEILPRNEICQHGPSEGENKDSFFNTLHPSWLLPQQTVKFFLGENVQFRLKRKNWPAKIFLHNYMIITLLLCLFLPLIASACYLRLAQITVGMAPDDFLLGKALSCRHNVSDGSANYIILRCAQPVTGQYLTIMNHKHIETDRLRDVFWLGCLNLCDVKIYVEGAVHAQSLV